ncbi:MAG: hypothetical protein ACRDRK_09625 [Pseudonocardia sp.]
MPGPLDDPYVYPGTKVLRNNRGLRDPDQLARAEADVTALALAQLASPAATICAGWTATASSSS